MLGVAGVITNSSGAILSSDLYDIFGVRRYSQGAAQTPFRSSEFAEDGLQAIGGNYFLPGRAIPLQKPMNVTKDECEKLYTMCEGDAQRDLDWCNKVAGIICSGGIIGAVWKCWKSTATWCVETGPGGVALCMVLCAVVIGGGCAFVWWYCNKRRHDEGIICYNKWKICMAQVKVDTPVKPKSS